MPSGSAVIIGSGPGIGRNVAAEFASRGFTDIALLARRKEQLEADTKFVLEKNANANVKTYEIDVTDLARLKSTLEQVGNDLGTPEFVFFNAARVQPSTLLEASEEEMSHEFTVSFFFFFFFFLINCSCSIWLTQKTADRMSSPACGCKMGHPSISTTHQQESRV
jgi:NAD(P)-dependent dehydrogenase (short-subunit alcohol dehydrogenase family)